MNFEHKSFSTHYRAPNPDIVFDKKNKILAVGFCWGKQIELKKYLDNFIHFYLSQLQDKDSTRPFSAHEDIDYHQNCLRNSMVYLNNQIYKLYNKDEFSLGLEILFCSQIGHAMYFTKTGQPHIQLNRNKEITVISTHPDLSSEFNNKKAQLPPLPKHMLGLFYNAEFETMKIRCMKNDQFLFCKRPHLPDISTSQELIKLDQFSEQILKKDKNTPFWCASLHLD